MKKLHKKISKDKIVYTDPIGGYASIKIGKRIHPRRIREDDNGYEYVMVKNKKYYTSL